MAEDKVVAAKKPIVVDCEPGEYWWCACGRSANQPWCDGSHAGTGIEPEKMVIEEKAKLPLCQCKHTGNPPMCDGSHRNLP